MVTVLMQKGSKVRRMFLRAFFRQCNLPLCKIGFQHLRLGPYILKAYLHWSISLVSEVNLPSRFNRGLFYVSRALHYRNVLQYTQNTCEILLSLLHSLANNALHSSSDESDISFCMLMDTSSSDVKTALVMLLACQSHSTI